MTPSVHPRVGWQGQRCPHPSRCSAGRRVRCPWGAGGTQCESTALLSAPPCPPAEELCQPPHARGGDAARSQLPRWELTLAQSHGAITVPVPRAYRSLRKVFKYFSFSEAWFSPLPFSPLCGRRYFCKRSQGGSNFAARMRVPVRTAAIWGLAGISCISLQGSSPSQGRGERAGCLLQGALLAQARSRARPVCPCNSPDLSTVTPSSALLQAAKNPRQGLV